MKPGFSYAPDPKLKVGVMALELRSCEDCYPKTVSRLILTPAPIFAGTSKEIVLDDFS